MRGGQADVSHSDVQREYRFKTAVLNKTMDIEIAFVYLRSWYRETGVSTSTTLYVAMVDYATF